jgi:predicted transcriptional regulator
MKKKSDNRCAVIARVPQDLRKRLDLAAKKARRSRSAELQARLEESLVRFSVLPSMTAEAGK